MEISRLSQRFLLGDGESRLLGVFGDPIAHSLSPTIHNLSLAYLDLNFRYLPFHVRPKDLQEALFGFRALGGVGFNATVPHKEPLLPLMNHLDPAAEKIGAVNTVVIEAGGDLVGYNTDAYGFITALREKHTDDLAGKTILVLGAGGACRAVLVALLDGGAEHILLANRTLSRAENLAALFTRYYPHADIRPIPLLFSDLPLAKVDMVVNTTSLGLKGAEAFPLAVEALQEQTLIYDIVYSANKTPLQKLALAHNLPFVDGLGMLIHQAARAFQIWTGHLMPVDEVKKELFGAGSS
ncbi:MAG: shikimate dehydrogenase [Magnetococcales bacterium]|nr:shikimate dehydrogenase [Magnetococcales bacterium]